MTETIQPSLNDAVRSVGLPAEEVDAWVPPARSAPDGFAADAAALSAFVRQGAALADRLPAPGQRKGTERTAAAAIEGALTDARGAFLGVHTGELYDRLTEGGIRRLRLDDVVYEAAGVVPGLVPTADEMEAERKRPLAEKRGLERAQGLLLEQIMLTREAGLHLIESMQAPTEVALEQLARLRATGSVDLGPASVTRQGRAGVLEIRNPRHLNAEDDTTLALTEAAADLILLDPEIEIGVVRGGVVEHPRYAGRRILGAGINLTRLYRGQIDFVFYLTRDLGFLNKVYRGLVVDHDPVRTIEKLWIAAVEIYAIGGACQLLHVVDHVIAGRGAKLSLPARKEGILPGVSNLRLPRSVGDRAARQAILSGREWTAGDPDADLLVDEVVEHEAMDEAITARVQALTDSGLVSAAANRKALRVGEEPVDIFREYCAVYAREQVECHLSEALVRNLERHWNAAERAA
jgi:enoyl-CoA hydratase/carnithine racemase